MGTCRDPPEVHWASATEQLGQNMTTPQYHHAPEVEDASTSTGNTRPLLGLVQYNKGEGGLSKKKGKFGPPSTLDLEGECHG